jgi:hypothetical protein
MTVATAVAAAGCASAGQHGTGVSGGGAAASCVAPQLRLTPATAKAGATVQASGKWFAADCYDTGQGGVPRALTGLTIRVSQHGHSWTVARDITASGPDYSFHVPVRLPAQLRAGPATADVPDGSGPISLTVDDR